MSNTEMQNFGLQMYNLKGAVKINMYHLTPPSDQLPIDKLDSRYDKPNGFVVHLPSRVKSLGGNLFKYC